MFSTTLPGKSPSWYLRSLLITDTVTKTDFPFINDCWLAVESDDGRIERRIYRAGEKELKKFHLVFASTVSKGLLDGHIWFSIFLRPKESSFTRVRRVSACLALIFLTMLTNAMFFGAGDNPGSRKILWLGNFKVNMTGIIIGIQSSIIVIPPSVIIIEIFRRLRPKRDKTAINTRNQKSLTNNTGNEGGGHDTLDSNEVDKKSTSSQRSLNSEESNKRDQNKNNGITNKTKNDTGNEGDGHDTQDSNEVNKKSTSSQRSLNSEESNKRDQNKNNEIANNTKKNPSLKNRNQINKKKKEPFMLPSWLQYFAYFVVYACAISSSLVCFFYSMMWGKRKSDEWLSSMFAGFFQSVLVIQPMKAVAVAILLAAIFRKPVQQEQQDEAELAAEKEEEKRERRRRRKKNAPSSAPDEDEDGKGNEGDEDVEEMAGDDGIITADEVPVIRLV